MRIYNAEDLIKFRDIPSSAVENTIIHGTKTPDPIPGRVRYYDFHNNIAVIVEEKNGKVVTTYLGQP